jgi:hypothetical protein
LPQIRNVLSSKLLLGNRRPNDRQVQILNESRYARNVLSSKLLLGNRRPNDRQVQLLNESRYAEMTNLHI